MEIPPPLPIPKHGKILNPSVNSWECSKQNNRARQPARRKKGKITMKNPPKPEPVTIELPDNIPGMIVEPLEVPEREIPEDWDI